MKKKLNRKTLALRRKRATIRRLLARVASGGQIYLGEYNKLLRAYGLYKSKKQLAKDFNFKPTGPKPFVCSNDSSEVSRRTPQSKSISTKVRKDV